MGTRTQYNKIYHATNKEKINERHQHYWRTRHPVDGKVRNIKERRKIIERLKTKPCMDCGGWFAPCQMDFDHRDSLTKIGGIANMLAIATPIQLIYKEIQKCDLICANCHRLRTHRRSKGDWYGRQTGKEAV